MIRASFSFFSVQSRERDSERHKGGSVAPLCVLERERDDMALAWRHLTGSLPLVWIFALSSQTFSISFHIQPPIG